MWLHWGGKRLTYMISYLYIDAALIEHHCMTCPFHVIVFNHARSMVYIQNHDHICPSTPVSSWGDFRHGRGSQAVKYLSLVHTGHKGQGSIPATLIELI